MTPMDTAETEEATPREATATEDIAETKEATPHEATATATESTLETADREVENKHSLKS